MKRNNKKTYIQLKAKYPGVILLLRCGDSYKSWDEDAKRVCLLMNEIELITKKTVTSCRIRIYQVDTLLRALIKSGYKCAICDPLEKPS